MIIKSTFLPLLFIAVLACFSGGCAQKQNVPSETQAPVDERAEALYAKAYVLWGRTDNCTDPERAIALLNSALDIAPNYAQAHLRRGLAYAQLGHFEDAFADITSAVTLAPTASNYAWRAFVLLREGNEKAAQRDLDFSFSLDEACREAWNTLGLLRLSQGDDSAACSAFARAAKEGDSAWLLRARQENICR